MPYGTFTYAVTGSATNSGAGTNQMGSALRISVYPTSTCTGTAIVSNVALQALSVSRPAAVISTCRVLRANSVTPSRCSSRFSVRVRDRLDRIVSISKIR